MRNCFSSQRATQFLISLWTEMDCSNAYSSIHRMFHHPYKCVYVCTIHVLCMHDSYCFVYSYRHSKLFPSVWYRILWSRWFVCSFTLRFPLRLSIFRLPSRILLVFRFLLFSFFYFISFVFPQIHRKPKSKRNARIGAIAFSGRERHGNWTTTELSLAPKNVQNRETRTNKLHEKGKNEKVDSITRTWWDYKM